MGRKASRVARKICTQITPAARKICTQITPAARERYTQITPAARERCTDYTCSKKERTGSNAKKTVEPRTQCGNILKREETRNIIS